MSNLGSFGSGDISPKKEKELLKLTAQANKSDDLPFEMIKEALKTANTKSVVGAISTLLVLTSRGVDVTSFCPLVVPHVASTDPQIRQLSHIFLVQHVNVAHDDLMMALNTFQRELSDKEPIYRALAIKKISSIENHEFLPAILSATQQAASDPSPYVRKAAAYAIIKAADLAETDNEAEEFIPILERLIADDSPIAFSGAIAAYWAICPENVDMLHKQFRRICKLMPKIDPLGQMFALRSLTVYARLCFKKPPVCSVDSEQVEEDNATFFDEEKLKEIVSADHILLIKTAIKLLQSMNSEVVAAAVYLIYYCAPHAYISYIVKPMIRLLYKSPGSADSTLASILSIIAVPSNRAMFLPHIYHFFVTVKDSLQTKKLKLKILAILTDKENVNFVMNKFACYASSDETEFASFAVKMLGRVATLKKDIIEEVLLTLVKLMVQTKPDILNEVVLTISHLLRLRRGTKDEENALRLLCKKFVIVEDKNARAAVISIVGDMYDTYPEYAPKLLQFLARKIEDEPAEVKLQALTLSAKLISGEDKNKEVPMYVLQICEQDEEFDVRDRARFLLCLIENKHEEIKSKLKQLLFTERKKPLWSTSENALDLCSSPELQVGMLSHFFNRALQGFEKMPDWVPEDQVPDESIRNNSSYRTETTKESDKKEEESSDEELSDFFGEILEAKEAEANNATNEDSYYSYGYYSDDE